MRPFTLVEDPGLAAYVQYICDILGGIKIKIPSRTKGRGDIIQVAKELRSSLKEIIKKECQHYSVTTDIWTSRHPDSYMALTIHYLTAEFQFRSWSLEHMSCVAHSLHLVLAGTLIKRKPRRRKASTGATRLRENFHGTTDDFSSLGSRTEEVETDPIPFDSNFGDYGCDTRVDSTGIGDSDDIEAEWLAPTAGLG
ncbi:Zinc finger BED domain-containing hypothetical protein [Phytophthora megakarya]|uniref:Uncharacterized protein n=1 Tax=Phytophthora megakarya TaxID=4795 RepID=A0A225VQD7_9STRA|nr:Zinc finger BED domain-containing hypothetical protein [Phytophthora megakarya]